VHILYCRDQFSLASQGVLMIALLPHLAGSPADSIVAIGEATLDQSDQPAEFQLDRHSDHEVNMIRHDDEGEQLEAGLMANLAHYLQQEFGHPR
jgi:hypothetical protein